MEYAWRQHSNGLDAVLWVHADSSMSVTQAVNDIAVTYLRFSKAKVAPGAYAVNSALVREWLRTTCESSATYFPSSPADPYAADTWLLIFDNLDDYALI
jgi:hypothetical protein